MYFHLELKFVYLAPDTSVRKFTTDFSDFFKYLPNYVNLEKILFRPNIYYYKIISVTWSQKADTADLLTLSVRDSKLFSSVHHSKQFMNHSTPTWKSVFLPNTAEPLQHPRRYVIHSTSNTHGLVGPLMRQNIKVAGGKHIVDKNGATEGHWSVNTFLVDMTDVLNSISL